MGTAAYLHMRGLEMVGVRKDAPNRGRWIFMLRDPEGRGSELAVEYVNSESRKFDSAVRSLKKLCYDDKPTKGAGRSRRR